MKVEIKESPNRIAIFWLGNDDKNDESFVKNLRNKIDVLKKENYYPFIIESGGVGICQNTAELIKCQPLQNGTYGNRT